MHEELSDIKQVKDELREKRIKVNTLDADLQRGQHDVLSLRNQNELLSEKLRDVRFLLFYHSIFILIIFLYSLCKKTDERKTDTCREATFPIFFRISYFLVSSN